MRSIYNLLAGDPVRSWNSHGFVSLAIGLSAAAFTKFYQHPYVKGVMLSFAFGLTAAYLFYRCREWIDESKYRKQGTWTNIRKAKAGVSPKVDGAGDIIVARWLCIAGWCIYLLIWHVNI